MGRPTSAKHSYRPATQTYRTLKPKMVGVMLALFGLVAALFVFDTLR